MRRAMFPFLFALTAGASGCRTTAPEAGPAAVPAKSGLDPVLTFAKTDEQALYLKMVAVEHDNGIDVPKDLLHSVQGVVECRKDGVLESCSLRVRLKDRALAGEQPMAPELSDKAWAFVRQARPELTDERLVLLDFLCDYIGKKSPPFAVEDVTCKARYVRLRSEAVFGEPIAEEIAQALRGEAPLGTAQVTLAGAVSCRFVEGSQRTPCTVRAVASGVLRERVVELSARHAGSVARRLLQATLDHTGAAADQAPRELMASVICVVDSSAYESHGTREHLCRAKL